MKKKWIITAVCAVLVMAVTACSGKKEDSSASSSGPLKAAVINGGDSYAFLNSDGELSGEEPTVLKTAAEVLGTEIEIIEVPDRDTLLAKLDSGEVQIGFGCIPDTADYGDAYTFTQSYHSSGVYLLTGRGNYVDTVTALSDSVVGVSAELPAGIFAEIQGRESISRVDYDSLDSVKTDLETGMISGFLCTEREAVSLMDEKVQAQELHQGPKMKFAGILLSDNKSLASDVSRAVNLYLDREAVGQLQEETKSSGVE